MEKGKKQRIKQFMALFLSAVMTLGSIPADMLGLVQSVKAEPTDAQPTDAVPTDPVSSNLLLHYDFSDETAVDTGTIVDKSGNGNDGTLKGNGARIADGALSLPGGVVDSGAAYVEYPTGMFDSKNTLTISFAIKNETGADNYAAMFFGTAETPPKQYWLFNPQNREGRMKSVITNDKSESPWTTEYGISPTNAAFGVQGPQTNTEWSYYTTVITENSITGYFNGTKIEDTVNVTRKVSDFGTGLVGYIGKSSYADPFFKGMVRDVKVYNTALTDAEIQADYDAAMTQIHLAEDKAVLTLPSEVRENITLPQSGEVHSSVITWESDTPDCIATDGTVKRPAYGDGDKVVTLTATLTLNGQTNTKTFEITVKEQDDQGDLLEAAKEIQLGSYYVTKNIKLPSTLSNRAAIGWETKDKDASDPSAPSAYITQSGEVTRPKKGEGNKIVNLTAAISLSGQTVYKDFELMVMEEPTGYLLSYTGNDSEKTLANSLHLAYSQDGNAYTALNSDSGICFVDNTGGQQNGMLSPYLFRTKEGADSYGLIATNNDSESYVYVFRSEDLIYFTDETKLDLNTSEKVQSPRCEWDGTQYVITWTDGQKTYQNTSADLKTASQPKEVAASQATAAAATYPEGAKPGNVLEVNETEYNSVVNKLAPVTNTGIGTVESEVTIQAGEALPDSVKSVEAFYSDGSTATLPITWDESGVNYTREGTYEMTGTVGYPEYENPFIESKADPCITRGEDGYYYFTASYPMNGSSDAEGYSKVTLRRAATIQGLQTAEEVDIWKWNKEDSIYRFIWAPEIHQINGQWYVFFTGSVDPNNTFGIRPHILVCEKGADPMDKNSWTAKKMDANGYSAFNGFSLDMTEFSVGDKHYVIWAEKDSKHNNDSVLYMASIDPNEPWKLTSEAMLLTRPEYAWENIRFRVNEGPSVIQDDTHVYVCFSAAGTGPEYCIGMMTAEKSSDLLNPESWTKTPYPILASADVNREYGPGHNSFTVDEYGNDVFVYHARSTTDVKGDPLYDPGRHARIKTVHWAADGTPILKMTDGQAVKPENSTVKMKVNVQGNIQVQDEDILAKYDFKNGVRDASGNGNDGTIVGNATVRDGVLTLPGATAAANTNYVELPGDMFENQDTLTIDMWLRSDMSPGNYAAMFFGTKEELPVSYWLLNPTNRDGKMKDVFTDSEDPAAPYNTEVGISPTLGERGIIGPDTTIYKGTWVKYTTVITPEGITGYLNGEKIGSTVSINRTVSSFGTDLAAYIGKSSYPDPIFAGSFKNITIYKKALTDTEIKEQFNIEIPNDDAVKLAAKEYVLEGTEDGVVTNNLELAELFEKYNVTMSWTSSEPELINAKGEIVGDVTKKTAVTLTVTFTKGEEALDRVFKVYLLPKGMTEYSMNIDGNAKGVNINDGQVGLFFEDINNSADGGLNPQMVKNYSFENYRYDKGVRVDDYKNMWLSSDDGAFVIASENSLNGNNPNYARLTGDVKLTNNGFTPINSLMIPSMAVKKDVAMDVSMFTRADASYTGTIKVKLQDVNGNDLTEEITLEPAKTGEWGKVTGTLTGKNTALGRLIFTVEGANGGVLDVDMISVSPTDTFKYGDKNYGYGAGLRADLVQKLKDIKPGFIRFPGGCIIEGAYDWTNYYNWENTIGPLETRRQVPNMWGNDASYGYMQSYGFGYHEILSLCEEFGAEPYPILNAGVLCQARSNNMPAASGEQLDQFAKEAIDLLDYCWGDAEKNEMAAKRKENGHAEPFNLKYIGIGNENWDDKYFKNFDYIYDKLMEYKDANYPDHELTVIAASGTAADDWNNQLAWNWLNQKHKGDNIMVDEHYYVGTEFSETQDDRYDYFLREEQGGLPVFLGEYATRLGVPNSLESALADAAYMTGIERNSDVVKSVSYAPLFNKVGSTNWPTDLIWFDEYRSIGSINYYVQQMFSMYTGSQTLKTNLEKLGERYTENTGSPVLATYATKGYVESVKVTREDGEILIDETFEDDSPTKDLWKQFPGSTGSFSISDGKLHLTQGSAVNGVWLPHILDDPEWHDYKVEAVVVKEEGNEGFLIGGGAKSGEDHYWYNMGGWGDTRNAVQRNRTGSSGNIITNSHDWAHSGYVKESTYEKVPVGEELHVTFNYGVNDKLEAGYTSNSVTKYAQQYSMNLRPYQNDIYNTVSMDEDYVYVKLVNSDKENKSITLNLENIKAVSDKAKAISIHGTDINAVNTINNEAIIPSETEIAIADNKIVYKVQGYSVNTIMIPLKEQSGGEVNIEISPATAKVEVGKTVQLTATGNFTDLSWESSDTKIATIDFDGLVTGVKEGKATITAKDSKGNKATAEIEVTKAQGSDEEVKIEIKPASAKVEAGKTVQLTASGNYSGELSWESSDTKIATVDKNGLVTGVKAGKATITAKDSKGNKATAEIEVTKVQVPEEEVKIEIKPASAKVEAGKTVQLKASGNYRGELSWETSDKKIATVDKNGLVTGVKAGKATITAKDSKNNKATAEIEVTKVQKPEEEVKIEIKPASAKVEPGKTVHLKASGNYKGELSWETSNRKVAIVNRNGLVTGVKEGEATITVMDSKGNKATAKIEVAKVQEKEPEESKSEEVSGEWVQTGNGWWFKEETGSYPQDEWKEVNGTWYHFDNSGYMQTGWVELSSGWYYMDQSGAMQTGWVKDGTEWYYTNSEGTLQTGWVNHNDTWYYTNNSGVMQTGWTVENDTWYYLNASGAMQTGWVMDNDTWYYTEKNGAMAAGGWKLVNDTWYYLNGSGAMQTDWAEVNGSWYYLNSSGAMATGWLSAGREWYYLGNSGAMQVGWTQVNNTWYYLNNNGAMAANTWVGNYYVNATGAWSRTR